MSNQNVLAAAPDHIADARKMVATAAQGVGSGTLPANRYGVDCDYFTEKLEILIRDMGNYTPAELARSLGRLAMTADSETMREPEFNTAPAVQWEPEGVRSLLVECERALCCPDPAQRQVTACKVLRMLTAAPQPAEQQPDPFRGDNAALIRSAQSLLRLDDKGAFGPNGIGGHARNIITAFIARISADQQPAPDVTVLVDALERVMYCNEVKFLPEGVQQAVSDALAARRKGGGDE